MSDHDIDTVNAYCPGADEPSNAELDRQCAVKVMGWRPRRRPGGGWQRQKEDGNWVMVRMGDDGFIPTVSVADAFELLAEVERRGWLWWLSYDGAQIQTADGQDLACIDCHTPPRAVVLAVLAAVRSQK